MPLQITERLWTTIKQIDEQIKNKNLGEKQGSTLCVVYLDKSNLITANVGDSVAFVAIFNSEGKALGVAKLSNHLHHPNDESEQKRIVEKFCKVELSVEIVLMIDLQVFENLMTSLQHCQYSNS